jgi:hypothetical protein
MFVELLRVKLKQRILAVEGTPNWTKVCFETPLKLAERKKRSRPAAFNQQNGTEMMFT